jgi:hypothetical protein
MQRFQVSTVWQRAELLVWHQRGVETGGHEARHPQRKLAKDLDLGEQRWFICFDALIHPAIKGAVISIELLLADRSEKRNSQRGQQRDEQPKCMLRVRRAKEARTDKVSFMRRRRGTFCA